MPKTSRLAQLLDNLMRSHLTRLNLSCRALRLDLRTSSISEDILKAGFGEYEHRSNVKSFVLCGVCGPTLRNKGDAMFRYHHPMRKVAANNSWAEVCSGG